MRKILVKIAIADDKGKVLEQMTLEKAGPENEIAVLASGISTIFLKSKDALAIAKGKGKRPVAIAKKSR